MEFKVLSWQDLHSLSFKMATKIESSGTQFDVIVAAARGGLTISHIVSDILKLPITSFTITSYDGFSQTEKTQITYPLSGDLTGKSVLFIDDVSDTGKTFTDGSAYLQTKGIKKIMTAALFVKPWTTFTPDFYQESTDKWIVYPYDIKETIQSLKVVFEKEGLNIGQIRDRLHELGLPAEYITTYLSN